MDIANEIHTEELKKIKEKEQFEADEAELGKNCFPDDETFYKWYSEDDWIYHHKDDWWKTRRG